MKMKKYILLLISITMWITNVKSQEINTYNAKSSNIKKYQQAVAINKIISKYSIYEIPTEAISKEVESGNYNFTLKLNNELHFDFILSPTKIIAPNYLLSSKNKKQYKKLETTTYNGFLNTDASSKVALSIKKDNFSGIIIQEHTTYCFEPLNRYIKDASPNQVIFYELKDVNSNIKLDCGAIEPSGFLKQTQSLEKTKYEYAKNSSDSCETIEIAVAVDNDMFLKFSSDTTLVQQEIIDLLNLLGPLFSSPPLEIKFLLVETYIAAPNEIVADSETDFNVILNSFRSFGWANFTNPFGVATLWITRDAQLSGNFGTAGVAYLNGACLFDRFLVIEHLSPGTISQSHLSKLWAHELGHNFNANHAPQANSNIMAPLVSPSANTWTPTNISDILAKKNSASCLISCNVYAHFSANNTIVCAGSNIVYADTSHGQPTSFLWSFPGGTPSSSTIQNPTVQYNSPGNYDVTLIVSSTTDTDTLIMTNYINVNALPAVSFNINSTSCLGEPPFNIDFGSPAGGTYSGNGISGTTFTPSTAGTGPHIITYTYTDSNACSNTDTTTITVQNCVGLNQIEINFGIIIYPNPNTGLFTIEKPIGLNKEVKVELLDVTSKLITQKVISADSQKIEIDITNYSKGIYYLQFIIDKDVFVKQILKN
jgi:PKD repeat protein